MSVIDIFCANIAADPNIAAAFRPQGRGRDLLLDGELAFALREQDARDLLCWLIQDITDPAKEADELAADLRATVYRWADQIGSEG